MLEDAVRICLEIETAFVTVIAAIILLYVFACAFLEALTRVLDIMLHLHQDLRERYAKLCEAVQRLRKSVRSSPGPTRAGFKIALATPRRTRAVQETERSRISRLGRH